VIPYTHADHASRCAVATFRGQSLGLRETHVQAKVGNTVCCAVIRNAWDTAEGVEMWQLDLLGPLHGRMSAPAHRVRRCEGIDGNCSCSAFDGAATDGKRSAAVAAPVVPDGNHGDNL
jgi:hypothetical protein